MPTGHEELQHFDPKGEQHKQESEQTMLTVVA